MKKTSLASAVFVAGALAMGAAHATDSSVSVNANQADTTVLGAGPATSSTTTVTTQNYVYVQPSIDWDRGAVVSQMHGNHHLMRGDRTSAAATYNVPARAGEASTMTGGAPNAVTNNDRLIVGSYVIPYNSVTTSPYYVFSY